jgi:hypothetical protein
MLAAILAAAAVATVSTAQASTTPCGPSGYAYAGLQSARKGHGIAAVLTALSTPVVESGHVAGWIGVGGPGEGPGGADQWLQVGLNGLPGAGNTLYYEVMRPGLGASYTEITTDIPSGRKLSVAVLETSSTSGVWRVWVNGRPVSPPISLRSGKYLTPMAMGESWDGRRPACNRYSYRFTRLSIAAARGGSWRPADDDSTVLQDPGYRVIRRAAASFDARATVPLDPAPQPSQEVVVTPDAPASTPEGEWIPAARGPSPEGDWRFGS